MSEPQLSVLYCEAARRGIGNKTSYMGVFGPILLGPGSAFTLDKLVVATIVNFPASDVERYETMAVEVCLQSSDGSRSVLQALEPKSTNVAEDLWFKDHVNRKGLGDPELQAVGLVVLRGIQIEAACQIEVRVICGDLELKGNKLMLAPMSGAEVDDPAKEISASRPTIQAKKASRKSSAKR